MAKERISITIGPDELQVIDAATELAGLTRSAFVRTACVAAARTIAEEVDVEGAVAEQAKGRARRIENALNMEEAT